MSLTTVIDISKILSDETRVKILLALQRHKEMCVFEIAESVGASQSATSHQLAKLEAKDVVVCFRDGQKMCYELSDSSTTEEIKRIISTLL